MFTLKPISEKLVYSTHKHTYKHILQHRYMQTQKEKKIL